MATMDTPPAATTPDVGAATDVAPVPLTEDLDATLATLERVRDAFAGPLPQDAAGVLAELQVIRVATEIGKGVYERRTALTRVGRYVLATPLTWVRMGQAAGTSDANLIKAAGKPKPAGR